MGGVGAVSFPASSFPKGWFQVGWSHELQPGEVQALRYFGEHLVMWRGETGNVYLQDAYCLHLGAHRGVQGTVKGDDLECPWHGWQWDGEGRNACIPYGDEKRKPGLKIRTYPVKEWNGLIVTWYSPIATDEPEWELSAVPELDRSDFYPIFPHGARKWEIRAHVQMPVENAVDPAHIMLVHGSTKMPTITEFTTKDHTFVAEAAVLYGGGKERTTLTPEGEKVATFRIFHEGLGISTVRWGESLWPTVALVAFTPIDQERMAYFYHLASKRGEGEEGDVPQGRAARMMQTQWTVVEQDFFTWENMSYRLRANFVPLEAENYGELRRWAAQFYAEADGQRMLEANPVEANAPS
jgi:phenylpropionate dioxygenase-like ring-hydroxylating dioxygenase large terminal subunit